MLPLAVALLPAANVPPVVRTPIVTAVIEPPRTVAKVPAVRIGFSPGQPTARHLHPMPVIGYVLSGEFIVQVEGGEPRRFRTGEVVYEPANTIIERYDNASSSEPAVLIAFYLSSEGQAELIRMLPVSEKAQLGTTGIRPPNIPFRHENAAHRPGRRARPRRV